MRLSIERKIIAIAAFALVVLLLNAIVSYRATRTLIGNDQWVAHTHEVLAELEGTISTVNQAESAERGFLLSGDVAYLVPYTEAVNEINGQVARVADLTRDNPVQQVRIPLLQRAIDDRLERLGSGIAAGKRDPEGARKLILSGGGKASMDRLSQLVDQMEDDERQLLQQRAVESAASARYTYLTFLIANLVAGALLVVVFYVTLSDIAARKRAEADLREQREWLRVTLSCIGDAVLTTDEDGRVTFMNPVAEEITGWLMKESLGKSVETIFRIVNEQTREEVESPVRKVLRDGMIAGLANHTVLIAKDNREVPIDDSGAPIRNDEGVTAGVVLVFRDISIRKQIEAEREDLLAREAAAREDAEAANRAKDEFLAVISHELRTPLNAILGWATMLRAGKLQGDSVDRALETIGRNAKIQAQLIEDLLDTSRIISGKLRLDLTTVGVIPVIETAIDSIKPAAETKGIHLHVSLDPQTAAVSGDPTRLQQVLLNLLSNAVKFTTQGGSVYVRSISLDSWIEIAVSDTGKGISTEFLPFVFERFRQADNTITRGHGGLGLGLAIVRTLVELHGGSIRAESAGEGAGATFTVRLPLAGAAI